MKINEIFNSIQGEGPYVGTPSTFLRLSECNLKCSFCDTEYETKQELPVTALKNIIHKNMEKYRTHLLVITGGEPLLQYDELKQLINKLNCPIQIETNGTIRRVPLNATYVISPKKQYKKTFHFYKDYDEAYFKFIIRNGFDLHKIKQLVVNANYHKTIYLQPEYSKTEEITQLILRKRPNFNYTISVQLHKYLNVN